MKKIAILIENLFEEMELLYPYYRLQEEGYEVHLVGTQKDTIYKGKTGDYPLKSTHSSEEVDAKDYDAVVIPGGYSPDQMRKCDATLDFVRGIDKENKPVAAICHGPWIMASCCDLKGKDITSFYSIKDDLINAGANYLDEEVVVDGNLITSRTPKDLIAWTKAIIKSIEK
jgi:deglycase